MEALTPRAFEITPRGSGGVSIVAVRGPGALELVAPLCGGMPAAGDFRLVRITDDGEEIDEALVLLDSPEEVELHVHGSPAVVRRLMSALRDRGAVGVSEGAPLELEERARRRLAFSAGEAGARILLDQAEGALRHELEALSRERGASFAARAARLVTRSRCALRAIEPTTVCLLGKPNAGKSTLFNALLGARRVVESAEAGTTRDAIRERVRLGAYPVDLVDTAGLREPEGEAALLEAESQRLARRAFEISELGLLLESLDPASRSPGAAPGTPGSASTPTGPTVARLGTFADRIDPRPPGSISALKDPTGARRTVTEVFRSAFELPSDPWRPGGPALFEREALEALEGVLAPGDAEPERVLERLLAPGASEWPDVGTAS